MQPVDFTTLLALREDLGQILLPARLEQVHQGDRYTLYLALRTLQGRRWLTLCWHPQAARICIGEAPPKQTEVFSFGPQVWHQLGSLALVAIESPVPWERVLDLQFAQRPGDPVLWHLYMEVMGKYSNLVLVNQDLQIVTAAYQVGQRQTRLRMVQTGSAYEFPPGPKQVAPSLSEAIDRWQERLNLVPGPIGKTLIQVYRGLGVSIVGDLMTLSDLDPSLLTNVMTSTQWQRLFEQWQQWLLRLEQRQFCPSVIEGGGYSLIRPTPQPQPLQTIIQNYYVQQFDGEIYRQMQHQIQQKLVGLLGKLYVKRDLFVTRLSASDGSELPRNQADLLMAHLHQYKPGMTAITLEDFTTGEPTTIALAPDKTIIQNAQGLYKRHQKLKRSRQAIEPLLAEVQAEVTYLEQVQIATQQLGAYQTKADLLALEEIRDELVLAGHLPRNDLRTKDRKAETTPPRQYHSPSGYEILIGRNNRQNDQLTFRSATDYDLWFHTQEIPGSHVLLKLPPGAAADQTDLQFTADLAAFYSKARESDQAPVVYTRPKHLYKPKGAKPGMVIYKQETVIWASPQRVQP
ncbi:MAG: fibronectin-binding domain-containing protein [Alkalinema sp. RU_4_3]|nr:fibronectin-binding domain-containing protein [Alkalinema sp. RU_4_3]